MSKVNIFQTTSRIISGPGSLAVIGAELKQLGAGKVLIVTDQGLVAAGLAQRLGDLLDESGLSWSRYDKVEPDPRYDTVAEVVEAAQGFGPQSVGGFGGRLLPWTSARSPRSC